MRIRRSRATGQQALLSQLYFLFAVGLTATLSFLVSGAFSSDTPEASAQGSGPEMTLAVENGGECDSRTCAVAVGRAFTLSVEIIQGPTGGYVGAQSFINFGADLIYDVTATAAAEVAWTDCETFVAIRSQLSPETVSHGCLTGLPPVQPTSTYTGVFVDLAFICTAEPSSTLVRLLPFGDPFAGTSGTKFVLETGESVAAKVSDLTIACIDLPTATSTPAPTSSGLVGDASCDGRVDALDAAFILQLSAGLITTLPCPDGGDANGDDVTNPVDAILVLQFAAGLLGSLPP